MVLDSDIHSSDKASVTGDPSLDYTPQQPNLYKMMCRKHQLNAEHDLQTAYRNYRAGLSCIADEALIQLPLISERAYAQETAVLFHETATAGHTFTHQSPTIIGKSNHRPIQGTTRSQYIACIGNACVRGRSATIKVKDKLLLDFQDQEPLLLDDEYAWDPSIFYAANMQAWYLPAQRSKQSLTFDTAFFLLGAHSDFFGHWMCEYLPKYIAATLSGHLPKNTPILIDAHMPASHKQALEFIAGDTVTIIEIPSFVDVHVKNLWCAPTLFFMPLHEKRNEKFNWDIISASPERFLPVIEAMNKRISQQLIRQSSPGEKIFLARKSFKHRAMINQIDIEQCAADYGFTVVYPEDLSFIEQVNFLHHADYVIAPEGSAIFLMFFAQSNSKLIILSHPFTDVLADYNGLLGAHGITTTVLTGPVVTLNEQTPHDSDYEIDRLQFIALLDALTPQSTPC
jgi:hypothetical protein